MATTVHTRPRATARGRASARGAEYDTSEAQYDLLTAALIGVAFGIGTTLLLRRGPGGSRPIAPALRAAGKGARWAGTVGVQGMRASGRAGARGAEWLRDRGEELWERVPMDEMADSVRDYLAEAREAIDETVASELADLRKAMRRQRKRLGL